MLTRWLWSGLQDVWLLNKMMLTVKGYMVAKQEYRNHFCMFPLEQKRKVHEVLKICLCSQTTGVERKFRIIHLTNNDCTLVLSLHEGNVPIVLICLFRSSFVLYQSPSCCGSRGWLVWKTSGSSTLWLMVGLGQWWPVVGREVSQQKMVRRKERGLRQLLLWLFSFDYMIDNQDFSQGADS